MFAIPFPQQWPQTAMVCVLLSRHNFGFHLCGIQFRSLQKQRDFVENLKISLKPLLEGSFPFCSTETVNDSIAL